MSPKRIGQEREAAGSKRRFVRRWAFWLVVLLVGVAALYSLAVVVLGRIPVNPEFRNAADGIPIVVMDNGIHVDFLLPISAAGHDWRQVFDPAATRMGTAAGDEATHVLIGWGHRYFYLFTPTWADLTIGTAVRAFLGIGGTVMHVTYTPFWFDDVRSVILYLSPNDYLKLVSGVASTAIRDTAGQAIPLDVPGYDEADAFYEAKGRYNALYTCNNWAASVLARAGVRVPLWSPFSNAVMDQVRKVGAH